MHTSTEAGSSAARAPESLTSFFRHHGLWAPGVRGLRRLRFRTKAVLISAVLLIPAIVLGVAFLSDTQAQLEFSRKERHGVALMQHFTPVLLGVLEARNATRAMLGDFDASKDFSAARRKVDAALAELGRHLQETRDPLQLGARVKALQDAWTATAASTRGVDDKGRTVFGPVTEASIKLLQGVTDDSNLVLDPDLDTLYMIMATFINLPKASEDLGQLWGWGTFGVARGGLESPEQYRRHAVWQARAQAGIEDALVAFERAFEVQQGLRERVDLSGLKAAQKFQASSDITEMVKAAVQPEEVYASGHKAVQDYFRVFDSALPALDARLAVRVEALEARRNSRFAVVLLSLAFGAYLFICFSKVLEGGLRQVAHHLGRMADGDLTQTPRPWGTDEEAELMHELGRTQRSMQSLVRRVHDVADTIVHASSEIASGSADLSVRTERTAAELQQAASSLEQIGSALGRTNEGSRRAAGLAAGNADLARGSGGVIAEAVDTMGQIQSASQRIGDIIGTIDGIAFQTNILALNAAVEAARAGEQGRGFAVVASEVRSLAQRSSIAAREIKSLVVDTVEKIGAGAEVVGEAGRRMDGLVGGAGDVSGLIAEIAESARQQDAGVRQIGAAVAGLDRMTQENAALVEQTAAASESLRERARELAEAVSLFRVTQAQVETAEGVPA